MSAHLLNDLHLLEGLVSRIETALGALLADAGLDITELARDGDGWKLRVRPRVAGDTVDSPALECDQASSRPFHSGASIEPNAGHVGSVDEPSEERAPYAIGAAAAEPEHAPDPVMVAEPLVASDGEDLESMISRESDDLVVTPVRTGTPGITLDLLTPAERARLKAIATVGDIFMNLAVQGLAPDSPSAVEAVTSARSQFLADGEPQVFDVALRDRAPSEFPGLGLLTETGV